MTIVNSAALVAPGFGTPLVSARASVAMSGTGQQTFTVPSSGSLAPTARTGYVRVKVFGGGGTSPTLTDILITATDGTATYTIDNFHPNTAITLSGTAGLDYLKEFCLDINATSISVLTTMGGTSPTATGDVEIVYAN